MTKEDHLKQAYKHIEALIADNTVDVDDAIELECVQNILIETAEVWDVEL